MQNILLKITYFAVTSSRPKICTHRVLTAHRVTFYTSIAEMEKKNHLEESCIVSFAQFFFFLELFQLTYLTGVPGN